ncbi:MAG TPA: arylsulfatase [Bryobacteraceae bacterium]|nr:arylsulfatase [Bryobacteraceae bacterium]
MIGRRQFLGAAAALVASGVAAPAKRPNILFVITDDQGFGDLSIHGNPHLRTPNMDRIGTEGVRFTQFHVTPVCSPTRASLMTGRYNYRTGVVDTYLGRSMMHGDERTLPEMLRGSGYATGLFGKWHLGDNYPMRPVDQGFDESVAIKGGGLGQPSDFPGGGSYTDPILLHNGKPKRYQGYCTDIYVNEASRFMEANRDKPFFAYVAMNAPHTPLEIEERYVAPFRKAGLDDVTAKVYGMVINADENVGRLLNRLDELQIAENTIVVFMTDNGPQQRRFNAGMRGLKGSAYEGGIRVPFFVRWPAVIRKGSTVDRVAAHIDVTPTLLEAAGAVAPSGSTLDGRSLLPLFRNANAEWRERTIFTQWHRGDEPVLFQNCMARTQRWKLVNGKELYDLDADPAESKNLADTHPDVAANLRREYEDWFRDVSATRGYTPPRISLGSGKENPVILTRQDWRGPRAGWTPDSLGHWEVRVEKAASYEVSARFAPATSAGTLRFRLNGVSASAPVAAAAGEASLGRVRLPRGDGQLEMELESGDATVGIHYVTIAG